MAGVGGVAGGRHLPRGRLRYWRCKGVSPGFRVNRERLDALGHMVRHVAVSALFNSKGQTMKQVLSILAAVMIAGMSGLAAAQGAAPAKSAPAAQPAQVQAAMPKAHAKAKKTKAPRKARKAKAS